MLICIYKKHIHKHKHKHNLKLKTETSFLQKVKHAIIDMNSDNDAVWHILTHIYLYKYIPEHIIHA